MIQGTDFLRLAVVLAHGATEADWRTAISRAYYGAFHEARQLLSDLGFVVPRADAAHAYLWMRLSNCGEPILQSAGSDLNLLRRHRNRADYELGLTIPQGDAQTYVRMARQIAQDVATGRVEPTRTSILNAMRVYERDVLKNVTWHP